MFRGKYLCALKRFYDAGKLELSACPEFRDPDGWKEFINLLFSRQWLPFVKEIFNEKGNAIAYLARYSYHTAISNSRMVSVTETGGSFLYKDYKDGSPKKTLTVDGEKFIGMNLQHILPSGFSRIRYAGYLTNCVKTRNLKLIHRLRRTVYPRNPYWKIKMAELMKLLYGKDICSCPECSGKLIRLPRGMPLSMLPPLSVEFVFAVS